MNENDPCERTIKEALIDAGIRFLDQRHPENPTKLDFYLIDLDISIEVKRFYTDRAIKQMARAENVILVQGLHSCHMLASLFRATKSKPDTSQSITSGTGEPECTLNSLSG